MFYCCCALVFVVIILMVEHGDDNVCLLHFLDLFCTCHFPGKKTVAANDRKEVYLIGTICLGEASVNS